MATKKEWLVYMVECEIYQKEYAKYLKALKKWISEQEAGEVEAAGPGSNPPPPPPPPPGT